MKKKRGNVFVLLLQTKHTTDEQNEGKRKNELYLVLKPSKNRSSKATDKLSSPFQAAADRPKLVHYLSGKRNI